MATPKHLIFSAKNRDRDEYLTPKIAVYPLLEYVSSDKVIWECTDEGNSNITEIFKKHGNKVLSSHIRTGVDFLTTKEFFNFDIIITNPPFSKKIEFIKRALELGKSFAFLLPLPSIGNLKLVNILKNIDVGLLVMGKRVNYFSYDYKISSVPFNSVWLGYRVFPFSLKFIDLNDYLKGGTDERYRCNISGFKECENRKP